MNATPPAPLDPLARAAVDAALALGWSVFVEAADQRLRLGPAGAPGRDLVIVLGPPPARPVVAELAPVAAEEAAGDTTPPLALARQELAALGEG
jgi:hypothetical protein